MKTLIDININKGKRRILNNYTLQYLLLLLKIAFINLISIKNIRNLNNYESIIHLVIKGSGNQKLLYSYFYTNPSEVLVNGVKHDSCKKTCNLQEDINNVTLIFQNKITSCQNMFRELSNIIEIDLLNFDFSEVNSMCRMFYKCSQLEKINFGNINTSSVIDMQYLFSYCSKINSIDLSNFNTSRVKIMDEMFRNCSNLTYLDLSNFDTSQVTTMYGMFWSCSNLKYLDLSNFDTSNLYQSISHMFKECSSLIYLNLISFKIGKILNTNDPFGRGSPTTKYCTNDEKIKNLLQSYNKFSNCSDICFQKNIKIDLINNKCIFPCEYNNYKYIYNDICYDECPKDTYAIFCDENECNNISECYNKNKIPQGYYLDLTDRTYKKCYKNCKSCNGQGNETINNCIKCNNNFTFLNDSIYKTNCYEKCNYYYYFDELNKYYCNQTCPDNYKKIIKDKNKCIDKCINDDTYKYEYNNICYIKCPNETYLLENNEYNICFNKTLDGYYLDKESETFKKCYETCNKCDIKGDEFNNNCIECKDNYTFYLNLMNISNCYKKCGYYYYFNESNDFHCTEKYECPIEYNKLITNKSKCINDCKNDDIYKYEYNNICYKRCPDKTYEIINSNDKLCYNETPEGYYLDSKNLIFKKCFDTCKTCYEEGNELNNNCKECKDNYTFYINLMNIKNCYETCNYYHYFNESNYFLCTENFECPLEYNKLIKDKNKCIDNCTNDNIYKYDYNNTCYKKCPNGTKDIENSYICYEYYEHTKIETTIINEINSSYTYRIRDERDEDIEQYRNEFVSNFNISENQEDIITSKDNVTYQMTTSDSQKNNSNKNISSIDLGDCEDKLKEVYKINASLPLIIFKVDYYSTDTLIPIIGYEIYHPINKSKLDLKYCEEILIKLNIPVNIDESKLFRYDPNSEYYTDNCFSYTTEDGTDITLNDRKKEYSNNNLALCENNCNYTGYNKENKQSSCDCNIKNKMDTITEIIENPNKLSNDFDSDESGSSSGSSNIISIKCTKALFSKEGLKNNISSYILLIFIGHFLVSILLFIKCGYRLLINRIEKILKENEKADKRNKTQEPLILPTEGIKKKSKKNLGKKTNNFPPKKYNINVIKNSNHQKQNNKNKSKSIKMAVPSMANKNINNIRKINKKRKNLGRILNNKNNNNKKNLSTIIKSKTQVKLVYNEYELNSFDYRNAILGDKRTCCDYYLSLLKRKNPLIFSFCPINDYNSMIIKTCIFSLSFSIYYAINFAFFDDSIMHKIYEEGGKYDVVFFISKITISFFASYYITVIIKLIFLSERNILLIRNQLTLSQANYTADKEKKNLVIKYTIFFIGGLIFLVFFWMLLSSFGAVYQNTQMFIFKNALISFAMSLCYPFFINIFPCLFRMCSLNSKESQSMYKFSQFLQVL